MIYYNWVGKPITSINEVKNHKKMYHFSSGSNGLYGVPEDDIYVISYGLGGGSFNAIKLQNVVLDNLGNPTTGGSFDFVAQKPGSPASESLEVVFKRTIEKGLPIHEVKSSLDVAPAAVPAAVGGRKNKKSHKKSHKKSQKKSHKKNKTSRRHK
jgi:hypothetical protein